MSCWQLQTRQKRMVEALERKDQLEALDARVLESYQNGGREWKLAQRDESR
jgi:hypothetical protein